MPVPEPEPEPDPVPEPEPEPIKPIAQEPKVPQPQKPENTAKPNKPKEPEKQKKQGNSKKMLPIIIAAVCAVVLIVVGLFVWNWYANAATYITLNESELTFGKAGSSKSISVEHDGHSWDIETTPFWAHAVKNETSFTVTCTANTTGKDRQGFIVVKSGHVTAQLAVTQKAHASYIRLSESELNVDRTGGAADVRIESDSNDFDIQAPHFCHIEKNDTGIKITFDANDGKSREGEIIVSDGNVSASLHFQQEGGCDFCGGEGTVRCSQCGGSGQISEWGLFSGTTTRPCGSCGGTGRIPCPHCSSGD